MPNSNLSSPAVGMSLEELTNLMFQYYRELQYLLNGNLDEQNVIRAQSVIADWIYTGGITTDQITAGTAKITTAMIETLTVGDNVIMGEDAAISWSQVTDQPTIITTDDALAAWANSNYATYIDANGVYTGILGANHVVVSTGASDSASLNIDVTGSYYITLKAAITGGLNSLVACKTSTLGGAISKLESIDLYATDVYLWGDVHFESLQSIDLTNTIIDFSSASIDFTSASVTGLTVPAVFSQEDKIWQYLFQGFAL